MDFETFLRGNPKFEDCFVSVNEEGRVVLHFSEESFIVFGDRTLNEAEANKLRQAAKPATQGVIIDTGILAFGGMGERE